MAPGGSLLTATPRYTPKVLAFDLATGQRVAPADVSRLGGVSASAFAGDDALLVGTTQGVVVRLAVRE